MNIMDYSNLLFIDVETTGNDSKLDKIIEVGIYNLENTGEKFEPVDELNYLIKIDDPIPPFIVKLTKITDEMLQKDGVEPIVVYDAINGLVKEKTLIIAFNSQFDMSFVHHLMRMFNNDETFMFECDMLDVMAIYKDFYKYDDEVNLEDDKKYGHRLCAAIKNLEVDGENSHRALDDTKATYQVLRKLFSIKDLNFEDYINAFGFNGKWGVQGEWIRQITYVIQYYSGTREIKKYRNKMRGQ